MVCCFHLLCICSLVHTCSTTPLIPLLLFQDYTSVIYCIKTTHTICSFIHFITKHLYFLCFCLSFSSVPPLPHLPSSLSAPWPPPADCRPLSWASRHVVSSLSSVCSCLRTIFSSQAGNCIRVCMCPCSPVCMLRDECFSTARNPDITNLVNNIRSSCDTLNN